jgi:hypothetical protein
VLDAQPFPRNGGNGKQSFTFSDFSSICLMIVAGRGWGDRRKALFILSLLDLKNEWRIGIFQLTTLKMYFCIQLSMSWMYIFTYMCQTKQKQAAKSIAMLKSLTNKTLEGIRTHDPFFHRSPVHM